MGATLSDLLRAALLLPEDCTDQDVVAAIQAVIADNVALRRRVVEEGTDLYQELAKARKEIAALVEELRALKGG